MISQMSRAREPIILQLWVVKWIKLGHLIDLKILQRNVSIRYLLCKLIIILLILAIERKGGPTFSAIEWSFSAQSTRRWSQDFQWNGEGSVKSLESKKQTPNRLTSGPLTHYRARHIHPRAKAPHKWREIKGRANGETRTGRNAIELWMAQMIIINLDKRKCSLMPAAGTRKWCSKGQSREREREGNIPSLPLATDASTKAKQMASQASTLYPYTRVNQRWFTPTVTSRSHQCGGTALPAAALPQQKMSTIRAPQ